MQSLSTESFHFGAVILAAGASARMGRPKQLLRLDGRSLIQHVAGTVLASPAWPVVVVLGAQAAAIRPELARLPVIVVENKEWEEGLSSSIRAGVGVIESFSLSLDAAMLVLCDQPGITAKAIVSLADACRSGTNSIAASHYDGHPGPPVIFRRAHFHELMELHGPAGAKPVVARHLGSLATIDFPELEVDLDTPEDFAAFGKSDR